MREINLDGCAMTSRVALHAHLKETLCFPDHYGNNLDALSDCLSEIAVPTHITLSRAAAIQEALGSYGDVFLCVLREAVEENENITLTIEGEN